ncbi:hypothetical protein Goklo_013961 [Gossypium klotzschianum]|uniref:Uncharacterized protein n=1 Tax=Gossypium klotzschianum TaxID=34286 RepID=A0A7J8U662_9ROSI|nr:hypothetical protein [Gossypium klotzschianum]
MERGLADLSLENGEEAFPASDEVEIRVIVGAPWTFNTHLLIIHRIQENEDPMPIPLMYFRLVGHGDNFCPVRLKHGMQEMELGWALSLRAQSRKATIDSLEIIDGRSTHTQQILVAASGYAH